MTTITTLADYRVSSGTKVRLRLGGDMWVRSKTDDIATPTQAFIDRFTVQIWLGQTKAADVILENDGVRLVGELKNTTQIAVQRVSRLLDAALGSDEALCLSIQKHKGKPTLCLALQSEEAARRLIEEANAEVVDA